MSDPEPTTPQERLRRIEEETAQLDQHMEEAREAVRHASEADSLATPGAQSGMGSAGAVGGDAEEEDEPDEERDPEGEDRTE